MARRRKTTKPRRRSYKRRSSMGAVASDLLMTVVGVGAGAVVARQVDKVLKFDTKINSAIKVAAGIALPKFVKTPLVSNIGLGMIAVGAADLVGAFVPALGAAPDDVLVISGMDELGGLDMIGEDIAEVNGLDISTVNGQDDLGYGSDELMELY